jgi:hypothetical protein
MRGDAKRFRRSRLSGRAASLVEAARFTTSLNDPSGANGTTAAIRDLHRDSGQLRADRSLWLETNSTPVRPMSVA